MIGLIVGLMVIVLIMSAVIYTLNKELKTSQQARGNLLSENLNKSMRINELKKEIDSLNASFKNMLAENEEDLGFGQHVKWRSTKKPTSQTYRLHFDIEPNGQRILEELTARFKRNVFTDDERETCRRIGRAEVVDFIISRINTANDPRYTEQLELAHMEQNDE